MNCKYAQMFINNIFSSMNFKQAFRIIPALIKGAEPAVFDLSSF